ncbi:unnamed protein product, partial [Adineta ricciae]
MVSHTALKPVDGFCYQLPNLLDATELKIGFPGFIDKDHWPLNSPDLNPLDYCIWDEFVKVIDWNKVTSKPTVIQELKHA